MPKAKINQDTCIGCGACVAVCPKQAISLDPSGKAVVDESKCDGCGTCVGVCPTNSISLQ